MKQKKQWGKKAKLALHLIVWKCMTVLPLDRRKAVISDFHGKGFGDSPKYIALALHELDPSFRIVCLCAGDAKRFEAPPFVKKVSLHGIAAAYHQATAKFWIDNCRKNIAVKRKKQFYIQTWHGFALKRIEQDVPAETIGEAYVRSAKRDSAMIDLILSCSTHMSRVYRESFWYHGEVRQIGAPRNDGIILGSQQEKETIRRVFDIPPDKKMLLYAPTFRDNADTEPYLHDFRQLIAACEERFGGSFVCLVRLHPHAAKKASFITYSDMIINASVYPDSQDLLCAADVLVTDYSSVMFDFALSGRPCLLYAADLAAYTRDRNFYFDIEKLPFPLSASADELADKVRGFDATAYQTAVDAFFEEVGMVREGRASEKAAQFILDKSRS